MKLGGNPFRTILHISFFEADFFGVAVPRPDLITIPRSSLPDLSFGDDARQLASSSLTLSPSLREFVALHYERHPESMRTVPRVCPAGRDSVRRTDAERQD